MTAKNVKKLLSISITVAIVLLYLLHFSTVILAFQKEWYKYLLLAILGLVVTAVIASIVHELGHVLCGLILGFKVTEIKILFLKITFAKKFKISLVKFNDFGETVLVPKNSKNYANKMLACAYSGLAFSLFYVVFGMIIATTTKSVEVLVVFGLSYHLSAYILLINLFPIREDSDGSLLFTMLFKEQKEKTVLKNALQLGADILLGVEPKDVDSELLKTYRLPVDKFSARILYYRYLAYFEKDDLAGHMQLNKITNIEELDDEEYIAIVKEKFFMAIVLGDDKFIKEYADEVMEYVGEYSSPSDYRIHATYRIYQGENEWAKLIVKDGLNNIDNFNEKGLVKLEKRILESLIIDG